MPSLDADIFLPLRTPLSLPVYSVPGCGLIIKSQQYMRNWMDLDCQKHCWGQDLFHQELSISQVFRDWIWCTSLSFFSNVFSHYILFLKFQLIFSCLLQLQLLTRSNLVSWFFHSLVVWLWASQNMKQSHSV